MGFCLVSVIPRVPRREAPSRPSGADKEKERAQNEGSRGTGLGRPLDCANIAARRHGSYVTLVLAAKVAELGKARVNRSRTARF